MAYDGTTSLNKAVADLIKCSPKSNNKLAKVIGQAKNDLGIASKAKKLPREKHLQIYNHLVELYSQNNKSESTPQKAESSHSNAVEIISQTDKDDTVEVFSHTTNFDNIRIAFYILRKGKRERQVIALDGFFINALTSIGISKQDAPKWVQVQVNEWADFDAQLPITRQVKYLIMVAVVKGLSGSDAVFHPHIDDKAAH